MRKRNEQKLGDAIREMLDRYHLNDKLYQAKVISSWDNVVGPMIAKHTRNIYIHHKVLYIEFDNAALRSELNYARQKLVVKLNEAAGAEVISEVVFR